MKISVPRVIQIRALKSQLPGQFSMLILCFRILSSIQIQDTRWQHLAVSSVKCGVSYEGLDAQSHPDRGPELADASAA